MINLKLVQELAGDLRGLADIIETLANSMQINDKPVETGIEPTLLEAEPITIEKVRAVLAEKSQSGKQPEVKALIAKFSAKKLTEIDPSFYPKLLKEAEAL